MMNRKIDREQLNAQTTAFGFVTMVDQFDLDDESSEENSGRLFLVDKEDRPKVIEALRLLRDTLKNNLQLRKAILSQDKKQVSGQLRNEKAFVLDSITHKMYFPVQGK